MAGKRTSLKMTGGKEPRQCMWESIRHRRGGFTARDVAKESAQDIRAVEQYVLSLRAAGVIEEAQPQPGVLARHAQYRLISDEGAEHPRVNARGERTKSAHGVENVWRSLRILGGDQTAADLASAASVGGVHITESAVIRYLVALAEAGYVTHNRYAIGQQSTFKLSAKGGTGPRHPVVQKYESMEIYDPNLDEVVFAKSSGNSADPVELSWLQLENKRLRELLGEWLQEKDINGSNRSLIERTQLEMIPMPRSAMQ